MIEADIIFIDEANDVSEANWNKSSEYYEKKSLTLEDIKKAMDMMEESKPKCNKCGTAFDSYMGVFGFNCKCGCEADAKTPEGKQSIKIMKEWGGFK